MLGVSISKEFMPSIANTIGTDMSSYKIVTREQFAYGPVTSRNGDKVSIALLTDDVPAIISQAYTVFEITDKNLLLPAYLMMWFRRSEFDRYARYHSHGSAREVFGWEEMCDVRLPIPPLSRQREIVAEYETLTRRIRLNERLISTLESAAQTLYRRTFVDNIDPAHLPPGWRTGKFTELVRISGGGTPSTSVSEYWEGGNVPFYSPGDKTAHFYTLETEKHVTELGLKHCSSKLYPAHTVFVTARGATTGGLSLSAIPMAMNQTCYALLPKSNCKYYTHQLCIEAMRSLKEEAVGATFEALVTKDFENKEIVIPPEAEIRNYEEAITPVYELILTIQKESTKIAEMQNLLLTVVR